MHRYHITAFGRTLHETEDCDQMAACKADRELSLDPDADRYRPGLTVNKLLKYFNFWQV